MKIIRNTAVVLLALLLSLVMFAGSLFLVTGLSPAVSEYVSDTLSGFPAFGRASGFFRTVFSGSGEEPSLTGFLDRLKDAAAYHTEKQDTADNCACDPVFRPYYDMLDTQGKAAYERLLESITELDESVSFGFLKLSEEQFCDAWEAVQNDHPECFWLGSECGYSVNGFGCVIGAKLSYYEFPEGIETAKARFSDAAETILDGAAQMDSDYGKEIFIHDALAERVIYDLEAEYSQSAYSALLGGSTVCAGYARAFQFLMNECGIPCCYCTGTCGGSHAWNLVMLDGEYYNVDLTWDDACSSYDYFNRTDEDFAGTHTRTGLSIYLPACCGETYRNTAAMPEPVLPDFSRGRPGGIQGQKPGSGGGSGAVPGKQSPGFTGGQPAGASHSPGGSRP